MLNLRTAEKKCQQIIATAAAVVAVDVDVVVDVVVAVVASVDATNIGNHQKVCLFVSFGCGTSPVTQMLPFQSASTPATTTTTTSTI